MSDYMPETKEKRAEIKARHDANIWDTNTLELLEAIKKFSVEDAYSWSWSRNHDCKYIDIRIDMRDGGYILKDRHGKRIDLEILSYQYGRPDDSTLRDESK